MGDVSFVDEAVDFDFGDKKPAANAVNPHNAVGAPDYTGNDKESTFFSLGSFGEGSWKFTDNSLVDGPGDDLVVFEVGKKLEKMLVEISTNGKKWIRVGETKGAISSFDIERYAEEGVDYYYVRLSDSDGKGGAWPGADIDAIAAINCKSFGKPGPKGDEP